MLSLMSRNAVITAVVILVLVAGGWFLTRPKPTTTPAVSQSTQESSSSESATPDASSGAMMQEKSDVTITASGFAPQTITVKVGDSVTWMNSDTENHTVHSAPHPVHTAYPPLNLGVIKNGESKSLTFPTAGTYKYHDHLNPSLIGSVTVQ